MVLPFCTQTPSNRDAAEPINASESRLCRTKVRLYTLFSCMSLCELFGIEFCALFGITRPAKFERTARVARAIGVVAVGQDGPCSREQPGSDDPSCMVRLNFAHRRASDPSRLTRVRPWT